MCSETAYINDMIESWNTESITKTNTTFYEINNNLSIYIPHILKEYANFEYIKTIFHNLGIGEVMRIDFITHSYFQDDKVAFIHMDKWYNNNMVQNLQSKIMNDNEDAKLVYDDPNYWSLLQNKRPIQDSYFKKIDNLENIVFNFNKGMSERIYSLEKKNTLLEDNIKELEWTMRLHDTDIRHFANVNNPYQLSQQQDTNIYTNNSCCGAVSHAWNPLGESS